MNAASEQDSPAPATGSGRLPVGLLAGRLSWRAFARQLGVVPDTTSGGVIVAVVAAAGVVLALITDELPARWAATARPADGLRAE